MCYNAMNKILLILISIFNYNQLSFIGLFVKFQY